MGRGQAVPLRNPGPCVGILRCSSLACPAFLFGIDHHRGGRPLLRSTPTAIISSTFVHEHSPSQWLACWFRLLTIVVIAEKNQHGSRVLYWQPPDTGSCHLLGKRDSHQQPLYDPFPLRLVLRGLLTTPIHLLIAARHPPCLSAIAPARTCGPSCTLEPCRPDWPARLGMEF